MPTHDARLVIPESWRDCSIWPCPEISTLEEPERTRFERLRQAIKLRLTDASYPEILAQTGVCKVEVIRHLRRCLANAGPGQIHGFFALLKYRRVSTYLRRKPIVHTIFDKSAGCAGALKLLFETYPDVQDFVDRAFLTNPDVPTRSEPHITYKTLRDRFRDVLIKEHGLSDSDWPFCTKDQGYKSLRKYCESLLEQYPGRWIRARSGRDAVWKAKIGRGIPSILEPPLPLDAAQLDYLKCDAASVMHLRDGYGIVHAIPVSRWYLGLIADVNTAAIFGWYVSLEVNPSTDCALETVASIFEDEAYVGNRFIPEYLPDGKALLVSFVPELRFVGWPIIEVDNAWCHSADDFVNNVRASIGCTIVYCTYRAWWQHPVIERINGELTRMGLQRLVTSYGTGPGDHRCVDPARTAVKYDIEVDLLIAVVAGCIRNFNTVQRSDINWGNTRVEVFKHLLSAATSELLPARLPIEKTKDIQLLWHTEVVPIVGNREKGIRPYVNADCRYTCPALSDDWSLIGKKLLIRICRRDPRLAYGVLLEDGRNVGQMLCERRWRRWAITWQIRKLIIRWIKQSGAPADPIDPAGKAYSQLGERALSNKTKRGVPRHSKEALEMLNIERHGGAMDSEQTWCDTTPRPASDFSTGSAFGLIPGSHDER